MIKSQSKIELELHNLEVQRDNLKITFVDLKLLPPTLKNSIEIENIKLQILYKVNRILALKWVLNQVTDI